MTTDKRTLLMPDKNLTRIILLATLLSISHTVDHAVRGDFGWPPSGEGMVSLAISLAIYATIALGLYLYSKHRVGPGFWLGFGIFGLAFGWFAHFSPFTDQPLSYIRGAYASSAMGWLAVACLVALMLVLMTATVYAGYLCMNRGKTR